MIRFLVVLALAFHFSLTIVSCTTSSESGDEISTDDPIDESDVAGESDDLGSEDEGLDEEGGEEAPTEQAEAQTEEESEDDLDAELDEEGGEETSQAQNEEGGEDVDALEDDLSDQDTQEEPIAQQPPVQTEDVPTPVETPEPAAAEKAEVRDIRYLANSTGGTVVIQTSKPVTYQTRMNAATRQFVIEIAEVVLPASLQRPYVTQDSSSRIGSINAYQGQGSSTARVVIQLSGGAGEPIVQQEGESLVVIPPAPPVIAKPTTPSTPATTRTRSGALAARTLDEFLTGNQQFFGRPISLQVKEADVRDVVNFLAEESGTNIVMSDDVAGKISLKLRQVPWDQALVTVMRSRGLGYVRQGNVLRISTLKQLQEETEAATKIITAQQAIVPSIVEVIPVSYASLDDMVKNLTPFLSKEGKVASDNRTSTLIVTDRAEVVERARKLVKTLDIAPAQVSIESKIVEAVENLETFIGVNWAATGSPVTLSSAGGFRGAPVDLTLGVSGTTLSGNFQGANPFNASLNVGTLDFFGNLTAALTLAERDELAKVISSPRISTMNREKSTIKQEGENVSVISTRDQLTNAITKQEKRTPFSLELSVTPQITADGGVIMDLDVKREFMGAVVDAELQARPINKRSAKTKVLVRNGQTAVIGGIYTSDELEASNGVPGLKNIPILGWLFKNKSFTRSKNELLIFLTPRILSQEDQKQASITQ